MLMVTERKELEILVKEGFLLWIQGVWNKLETYGHSKPSETGKINANI